MNKFKVDCLSEEVCQVLQQVAFDNGITMGKSTKIEPNCRYLFVEKWKNEPEITMTHCGFGGDYFKCQTHECLSIEGFIEACQTFDKAKEEEKFSINEEFAVTLHNNGAITVGCTSLNQENITNLITEYEKIKTFGMENDGNHHDITFCRNGNVEVDGIVLAYVDIQEVVSKYKQYNK